MSKLEGYVRVTIFFGARNQTNFFEAVHQPDELIWARKWEICAQKPSKTAICSPHFESPHFIDCVTSKQCSGGKNSCGNFLQGKQQNKFFSTSTSATSTDSDKKTENGRARATNFCTTNEIIIFDLNFENFARKIEGVHNWLTFEIKHRNGNYCLEKAELLG